MMYYARSENANHEKEPLTHHLSRAAELCEAFLAPIGHANTGRILGGNHDLGKRSEAFQQVLAHTRQHVNHSYAGAAVVLSCYPNQSLCDSGQTMAVVIAAHHTGLDARVFGALRAMLTEQGHTMDKEGNEVALPSLNVLYAAWKALRDELPCLKCRPNAMKITTSEPFLSWMLLVRMLFSGLVDADYSSAAEHTDADSLRCSTGPALQADEALTRLHALRREKQARAAGVKSRLNALRDRLFDDCVSAGRQPPGLYTLTAPTGLGKTLALMAFALEHCKTHGKRRVILVLPYLSIIDQNVKEYRKIIPDLIESHSAQPLTDATRLLSERWSAPCVVTTTVGFFEPLFSARPGDCRRLHQIAGSVIVLDEAQALPQKLLDATLLCIRELCEHYGCTFVFSTATQPEYSLRKRLARAWPTREIVPNADTLYQQVRRVRYLWRLDERVSPDELADDAADKRQVLIIVNTKKTAAAVCEALKARRGAEGVFLISTDLCRAHREHVLDTIRERLDAGLPCAVAATQCIEAGVDISFPAAYRQLAPLEAIIQAAGRCNRNGDTPDGQVTVFRFTEDYDKYPDAQYEYAATRVVELSARREIDCSDPGDIKAYYALLYPQDAGNAKLDDAIQNADFQTVQSLYRLVDDHGVNVIVPWSGEKARFRQLLERIDRDGLTPALMRDARPLTVSVSRHAPVMRACIPILQKRTAYSDAPERAGWYYLGDCKQYDDTLGLLADALSVSSAFV